MNKEILITLPAFDDVTEYLSIFSKKILEECPKKQILIKKLERNNVTRNNVEKLIRKKDYKMVIFNGHGSPDTIKGHKNEVLIESGKNHTLLKDRIVYARSCWATTRLGKVCMRFCSHGCFIGYKMPFMFIIDTTRATNPIKDTTAKIFFDTSNLVPLGIIKGQSTGDSNENSKKSMLKSINKLLKKGDKDSQSVAEVLWNNYLSQELIGNPIEKL